MAPSSSSPPRGIRRLLRAVIPAALVGAVLTFAPVAAAEQIPVVPVKVAAVPDTSDVLTAEAAARVEAMTARERAASIVMGHIATSDPARLSDYMTTSGIGGFLLMAANIPEGEDALRKVTDSLVVDASLPPLVAIDQEGGVVRRLAYDEFPGARTLRALPASDAQRAFAARSALVARVGATVNFGIVADYTDEGSSFIFSRVLGTTAATAADRVASAVRGERGTVASTLKHFPGHGVTNDDSHRVVPESDISLSQWRNSAGVPFASGIDSGAELVMLGHLIYTQVDTQPASLSAQWTRILREEMGFAGVTVTDDLGMLQHSGRAEYTDPVRNAVSAVKAGNDLVLTVLSSTARTAPAIVDGLVSAVEAGELAEERLREAAERVTRLRLQTSAQGRSMTPCAQCAPVR